MILLKVRDAKSGLEAGIGLGQSHKAYLGRVLRLKTDMGHQEWEPRPPDPSALTQAVSMAQTGQLSPQLCPLDGVTGAPSHFRGTWVLLPSGFCSSSSRTPRPWLLSVESLSLFSCE